jgi:hypothetical protein
MAQRGDFTGKEAQRLQQENAELLAGRAQQIGLVNAGDIVVEQEGIWDPVTNQRLDPQTETKLQAQYQEQHRRESEDMDPAEEVMLVEGEYVTMRVFQDIDQMTYGVGNTFDLKRGRRYKVDPDLCQHLANKGLAERV